MFQRWKLLVCRVLVHMCRRLPMQMREWTSSTFLCADYLEIMPKSDEKLLEISRPPHFVTIEITQLSLTCSSFPSDHVVIERVEKIRGNRWNLHDFMSCTLICQLKISIYFAGKCLKFYNRHNKFKTSKLYCHALDSWSMRKSEKFN